MAQRAHVGWSWPVGGPRPEPSHWKIPDSPASLHPSLHTRHSPPAWPARPGTFPNMSSACPGAHVTAPRALHPPALRVPTSHPQVAIPGPSHSAQSRGQRLRAGAVGGGEQEVVGTPAWAGRRRTRGRCGGPRVGPAGCRLAALGLGQGTLPSRRDSEGGSPELGPLCVSCGQGVCHHSVCEELRRRPATLTLWHGLPRGSSTSHGVHRR